MAKLIHSMIRVTNLQNSIDFYRKALEIEVVEQYQFNDFTLAYLANSETGFELELTYNHNQTEPYGNMYGHLAVSVECIEKTHQNLIQHGIDVSDIKSLNHNNISLAIFFFITDPDGYKIEFIQRRGRYI